MLSSDLERLETQAKRTAAKHVAALLQRPDHLEKVDQYRRRVTRKKGSVEAMLKTAVQSQLDGVRSGLSQLQSALEDVRDIKKSLSGIEDAYKKISDQSEKLDLIRKESNRHSQLAAAMENLKNIFTVPETVKKTREFINDGKLLYAHRHLSDLESSRDDLLYELFKQPKQSPTDHNMLKNYFAEVERLSEELGKQMWFLLSRTLDSIRLEPTVIVTTLRIIEREERTDERWMKKKVQCGFIPPGRPKKWRQRCFNVLEDAVVTRIEGNQLEERGENRMWLVRHLEIIRQLTTEDLRVIKLSGQPCFPPHYDIYKKYIEIYHGAISQRLMDIICNENLEGNEVVTLMSWLNLYKSEEMMGSLILEIDVDILPPLLDSDTLKGLEDQYLQTVQRNIGEWMYKSLLSDIKDWDREIKPDSDGEGFFTTQLPVFIYEMIVQNLVVAGCISQDLVIEVMGIYFDELSNFCRSLKDELQKFKERHLADRNLPMFYIHYLIANVNNCLTFTEFISKFNDQYCGENSGSDTDFRFTVVQKDFTEIGYRGCHSLCDEVFMDLNVFVSELFTTKWLESNTAIDTICITIEDYCQDFVHLKPKFYKYLLEFVEEKILFIYLNALFAKKMTLRTYEERLGVAELMDIQTEQFKHLFRRLGAGRQGDSRFDCISHMAEVLKLKDPALLSLEISGLYVKHPDLRQEHLTSLLTYRGDIGTREVRELVQETIGDDNLRPKPDGIFTMLATLQ